MRLQIEELSISDPAWRAFVNSHRLALPFHHPAWARLLADTYGYRPLALVARDANGVILGGAPVLDVRRPLGGRRYVSLPFTDYCPLLCSENDSAEVTRTLVNAAADLRLDSLEIRSPLPATERVFAIQEGVRHTLPLSAEVGVVERAISKHHRRNIRRAEQADLNVRFGTSVHDMAAFYRLHLLTRQRLGVPIQPWRFFKSMAGMLEREQLGFIATVTHGDAVVAAAVFMTWRGVMIYKYGASDAAYWEHRPNNLLFWHVIRRACEQGFDVLDWGRTDLDNQGLREFKSGWGAREEPLIYSVSADRPPLPAAGRIGRAMTPVIRRSPVWVCRAMGEVLYRYAA